MNQPLKLHFDTDPATTAIERLAQAAVERPQTVQAFLAEVKEPLFAVTQDDDLRRGDLYNVYVVLQPTGALRKILSALKP